MTKLTFGKTEARKIAAIIDPEYGELDEDTQVEVEAIAAKVLNAAAQLVMDRAKYTVVGQFRRGPETRWTGRAEADASKGCLGFYSTAGDARAAAESLTYNSASHEEWLAWVLPVSHQTAADFHAERKRLRAEAAAKELAAKQADSKVAIDEWAKTRAAEVQAFIESLPEDEQKQVKRRISAAEWAALVGLAERSAAA